MLVYRQTIAMRAEGKGKAQRKRDGREKGRRMSGFGDWGGDRRILLRCLSYTDGAYSQSRDLIDLQSMAKSRLVVLLNCVAVVFQIHD